METLREFRRQKGWSQKDLAEASGIGQDTISGIERGHHEPRPSTLRKLAEALDVEVADFFREPAVPLAEAPREAGLSSTRVRDWLAENGGQLVAMSDDEFVDHLRELSAGKESTDLERALDQLLADIENEENATRRALRRELAYGGKLFSKVRLDTPEEERRSAREAQANWRLEMQLASRYNRLRDFVTAYSRRLFDAQLMRGYLVNPRALARDQALARVREQALEQAYAQVRGA